MRLKKHLLATLALLAGYIPSLCATNGLLQIGYGAKSKAMGGVGVALPQDAFASALNPAGMSLLGDRVDAGLHWLHQHAEFSTTGGMNPQKGNSAEDLWWPEVGFNRLFCCNQSFGVALFVGGEWDVHYKNLMANPAPPQRASSSPNRAPFAGPDLPRRSPSKPTRMGGEFPVPAQAQGSGASASVGAPLDQRLLQIEGEASASVEAVPIAAPALGLYQFVSLTPSWSWQINNCHSIGIAVNAVVGKMRIDSPEITNSVAPAFTLDRGNDYQWGIGARLGWLGQFSHCIQVGATYQTRTYMSHFRKYRGIIPDGGDADLPAQFGVGLAWQIFRGVVLSADAVKIFWREGRFFRNAFDEGSGLFGSKEGPGLGWDEQMVFKAGLSWDILECLTFRLGYNHGNCPIPRGNRFDVICAETVQDHGTIGFTWEWRCHQISFVYLHAFTNTIKGFEPVDTDSFLILKGRQDSVGIEYGYLF